MIADRSQSLLIHVVEPRALSEIINTKVSLGLRKGSSASSTGVRPSAATTFASFSRQYFTARYDVYDTHLRRPAWWRVNSGWAASPERSRWAEPDDAPGALTSGRKAKQACPVPRNFSSCLRAKILCVTREACVSTIVPPSETPSFTVVHHDPKQRCAIPLFVSPKIYDLSSGRGQFGVEGRGLVRVWCGRD